MRACGPFKLGCQWPLAGLQCAAQTLMDPGRRQLYDELAGFSMDSVNPFLDASYERDQVFVDEFT